MPRNEVTLMGSQEILSEVELRLYAEMITGAAIGTIEINSQNVIDTHQYSRTKYCTSLVIFLKTRGLEKHCFFSVVSKKILDLDLTTFFH